MSGEGPPQGGSLLVSEELEEVQKFLARNTLLTLFAAFLLVCCLGGALLCVLRIASAVSGYGKLRRKVGTPLSHITKQDAQGDNEVYAHSGRPLPSGVEVMDRIAMASKAAGRDLRETLDPTKDMPPADPEEDEDEEPRRDRKACVARPAA